MEDRVNELLARLTLEEKVALTTGCDFWTTTPVERLGIPSIWLSDGPHGVRKIRSGDDMGLSDAVPATCFPTASALASSWDRSLIAAIGKAIAAECHAQGVQVLLGPGSISSALHWGKKFRVFFRRSTCQQSWPLLLSTRCRKKDRASLKHFACNNGNSNG